MSYGEKQAPPPPTPPRQKEPMTVGSWVALVVILVVIGPFVIWAYRWAFGLL